MTIIKAYAFLPSLNVLQKLVLPLVVSAIHTFSETTDEFWIL